MSREALALFIYHQQEKHNADLLGHCLVHTESAQYPVLKSFHLTGIDRTPQGSDTTMITNKFCCCVCKQENTFHFSYS